MNAITLFGEEISGTILLLLLGYYLLQLEIGAITFGISAFLRSGAMAVGFWHYRKKDIKSA